MTELLNITSWQYHINEAAADDPVFAFEIASGEMAVAFTRLGKTLTEGFAAIGQAFKYAFEEVEHKERSKYAKDITPFEPAGLLSKQVEMVVYQFEITKRSGNLN